MKISTLIFIILLLISCKEKVTISSEQLAGKWSISEAIRNGKETKTLQSSFFVFQGDNSVNTNFPSMEENTTFTINDGVLTIGGNPPMKFSLIEFTGNSMKWSGKINDLKLDITLVKE